jgi:hypothetical protein
MSSPCFSFSSSTGQQSFHCPVCKSFVSIQCYIDLRSDFTFCRCCGHSVNVPALINSTDPAKSLPVRRISKHRPDGSLASRVVPVVGQLCLFGGVE